MSSPEPVRLNGPWRIGIDVGGTFTDLVLIDSTNARYVTKLPSTPHDPSLGVISTLTQMANTAGLTTAALLSGCSQIVHGSTVATNTLLEHRGSRVGLLCTSGFRDALEIRRGMRADVWNHREPYSAVLVPRYLRLPIRERMNKDGGVLHQLETDDVIAAANAFLDAGVESVAICFLHSFTNPAHEQLAARILRSHLVGSASIQWISLSSEVAPIVGEYERCSTTVVNAYLAPRVSRYLLELAKKLTGLGLERPLLVQQSNGGVMPVQQAAKRPVDLLLSGPAAGVGALKYFGRSTGIPRLISMEIGGTSTDVMLMDSGQGGSAEQIETAGYTIARSAIAIHTVGAGGGTIATVDQAGLLHVGPRGAGADPGPACYGKGGSDATVTDAQLVLGRLRSGAYAGGSVSLDATCAHNALSKRIAQPLGVSVIAAAAGIVRLASQRMAQAVEKISIRSGIDPRHFALVACGGAGPMHGVEVARMLGMPFVHVPKQSGAFCAFGMLNSDVRQEFERPLLIMLDEAAKMAPIMADLERSGLTFLKQEGFPDSLDCMGFQVDMRYVGQQWTIRLNLSRHDQVPAIREKFEAEHERLFGHVQPGGSIEITNCRVVVHGRMPEVPHLALPLTNDAPRVSEKRLVHFDRDMAVMTPVVSGFDMMPGMTMVGPLIIEEATTTILVAPNDALQVDCFGDYLIKIAGESNGHE